MEPTLSHKFRNSLIQLIAGLILVGLASWYLTNHPAEWQSIKSSVTTARQKISKLRSSARGEGNVMLVDQKAQALKSLDEIIASIKACDPSAPLGEYQALYAAIKQASLEDFARNGSNYYNQMSAVYQQMQQLCKK